MTLILEQKQKERLGLSPSLSVRPFLRWAYVGTCSTVGTVDRSRVVKDCAGKSSLDSTMAKQWHAGCGSQQQQMRVPRTGADTRAFMERWNCVVLLVLYMFFLSAAVNGEVYLVLIEGDPVVSYRGTIPGLSATHEFNPRSTALQTVGHEAVQAYSAHLVTQQDRLLETAIGKGIRKLYSYNYVVNGFAVDLTPEQAEILAKTPGVKYVERNQRVHSLTTHTPDFLGLSKGLWASAGGPENAGEGIVIGVVDTGINPNHTSFDSKGGKPYGPIPTYLGNCEVHSSFPTGSCNGKIIGAQHFAASAKSEGAFNDTIDFDSPLDGDGHGTHTASIAAGNHNVPVVVDGVYYGNASGMAPRARIAVYKALYRLFGGFNADVVAAIDKAVQDGVDILNLSLGPSSPPTESAITFLGIFDLACLAAVKAGVVVLQAAGNGGPYPQTTLSFSPWIITVGAGVDDRSYPNFLQMGNNLKLPGKGLAPGTPGDVMAKLVLAQDVVTGPKNPIFDPSDCQDSTSLDKGTVAGKILICTYSFNFVYGGSTIKRVEDTVRNLSAMGFIMVVQSDTAGSRFDPIPITVPGIIITSQNHSQILLDYYNQTTSRTTEGQAVTFEAEGKIGNGQQAVYSGTSPVVALYSSRGPDIRDYSFSNADVLKPNVLAPGSLIWAAWTPIGIDEPAFLGKNFAMMSGTSMATPHIAGIAALLLERNPTWSPAYVSSAISTTASIFDSFGNHLQAQSVSFSGDPDPIPGTPFDYGSGAVNATAAADPGIVFDANYDDYIKFICTVPGVEAFTVFNLTGSRCSVTPEDLPTELNTPSITVSSLNGTRVVSRTVTSVSKASETWSIRVDQPAGVTVSVVPHEFTISPSSKQKFVVTLTASGSSSAFSFGEIYFTGSLGHTAHIPVSVIQSQGAR
ncbi:hypothetical protein R1sor_007648 [Riccia sorocarpa]|uniref:Subtilisin-like protease n=1 Tax=Riccia sorocarpa TaxID=122646 RepID=A0ABD3HTY8_9MARC